MPLISLYMYVCKMCNTHAQIFGETFSGKLWILWNSTLNTESSDYPWIAFDYHVYLNILTTILFSPSFFFFFFFFFGCAEVPRLTIEPAPQQQHKPLKWQCWILNPLYQRRTPFPAFFPITFFSWNQASFFIDHFHS